MASRAVVPRERPIDVNLVGGLFLRAEWEYVRFTAATDTNINTVRAGLGYKF